MSYRMQEQICLHHNLWRGYVVIESIIHMLCLGNDSSQEKNVTL